jgi:hypothetical protein
VRRGGRIVRPFGRIQTGTALKPIPAPRGATDSREECRPSRGFGARVDQTPTGSRQWQEDCRPFPGLETRQCAFQARRLQLRLGINQGETAVSSEHKVLSWEHKDDLDAVFGPGEVLQFLIAHSFLEPFRWDVVRVFSHKDETQTRLYRTAMCDLEPGDSESPIDDCWRPIPQDPALQPDWVPLDAAKLAAFLSQLRRIRVPLTPAGFLAGCDGTTYQLAFGHAFGNVRITWWSELPEGWQELVPVVKGLEELFESTWREHRG